MIGFSVFLLAISASHAEKKGSQVPAANAKSRDSSGSPLPSSVARRHRPDLPPLRPARKSGCACVLGYVVPSLPRRNARLCEARQKELAPEGVELVPIANDDPAQARDFLAKKKLDVWSLFDEGHRVSGLYGANALPKTFVLDRNGVVVKAIIGKVSEADLRRAIETARAQ